VVADILQYDQQVNDLSATAQAFSKSNPLKGCVYVLTLSHAGTTPVDSMAFSPNGKNVYVVADT
jgi:hypothetical protein